MIHSDIGLSFSFFSGKNKYECLQFSGWVILGVARIKLVRKHWSKPNSFILEKGKFKCLPPEAHSQLEAGAGVLVSWQQGWTAFGPGWTQEQPLLKGPHPRLEGTLFFPNKDWKVGNPQLSFCSCLKGYFVRISLSGLKKKLTSSSSFVCLFFNFLKCCCQVQTHIYFPDHSQMQ